jgi:hypothetical protein
MAPDRPSGSRIASRSPGNGRGRYPLHRDRASPARRPHAGRQAPSGLLVALDLYTVPNWYACLFQDHTMKQELLPRLLHAQLERENGGVRLYGGIEVDRHEEWRQAWLCTPTPDRAREILIDMLHRERGDV